MIHTGLRTLKNFWKPDLHPLNTLCIERDALISNIHYLQSLHPGDIIIPVLKSNAYGHGLSEISSILNCVKTDLVAVDSFPEYQIVKNNTQKRILVLSETDPNNYRFFDFSRVTFAVWNVSTLKILASFGKKIAIHIFINTGLHREGVQKHQLSPFLEELKRYPKLVVDGVMSHFAQADEITGEEHTQDQIRQFKEMYQSILEYGHSPRLRHIGASAGTLKIQDSFFNAWRPGLAIYGYHPFDVQDAHAIHGGFLKPALSARTRIIALQEIQSGEGVSYAKSRRATQKTTIGLLPFGYYEGLARSLSNNLQFSWKGKRIHQVGNICMNLCCVDLGDSPVQLYDEIELFGTETTMSVDEIAQKMHTLSYEFLVKLNGGLRREIF